MGKVYLIFGIHNHQPTGNFHHVFEEAYQRCYLPLVSTLAEFPKVKFAIHTSGCLYDWILENRREYMDILKSLVKKGQTEIISGGYYEPILPLISDQDKRGQIELMNSFIRKHFLKSPQGIWVTERVWEPCLARVIAERGLKYTFLDDTHFRYAGIREKEFFGYYTTEDDGRALSVFPISKTLRYKMPFSKAEEAIGALNSFAREQDVLVTFFDDGEKFGLWPHTYDWVYNKGWLRNFLSLLTESDTIEAITPSMAMTRFASSGIVYLPTASYEEMGEWVLEPEAGAAYENLKAFLKNNHKLDEFKDFVRGGFFRNFYRKYPRLNYMHKRMFSLSRRLNEGAHPVKDKKTFLNLWKAQTNCGYWHGVFGGFYLGHIRGAIFENLINAENLYDAKYGKKEISLVEEDIDLDGNKEIILKNKHLIACFSSIGGSLLELSLRKPALNLLNTITRVKESYHAKIVKNPVFVKHDTSDGIDTIHDIVSQKAGDLDKFLIYDKYERRGLIEHLLDKNLTPESFNQQKGVLTLSNERYDLAIEKKPGKFVLNYGFRNEGMDFLKKVAFSSTNGIDVLYKFNEKKSLNIYNFGIEFNLFLPSLKDVFKSDKNKEQPLNESRECPEVSAFTINDYHNKIELDFKHDEADVIITPVYSVSSSEAGFEKVYQQLSVLFILKRIRDDFNLSLRVNKR